MSCIDGKRQRIFCGKEECKYHFEKSFASFQGMCCGASDSKECEENGCNCEQKKVNCWDKEKNGDITTYMVSKGTDNKAWFLCSCGYSWNPTISRITNKNGSWCPPCGIKKSTKLKLTTEEVIKRANELHNIYEKHYDYSKTIFKGSHETITVICVKHGEFKANVNMHLRTNKPAGCGKCGKEKAVAARKLVCIKGNPQIKWSTEYFINKATEIFGDRFDYSKVKLVTHETKVIVICHEHGEFEISPRLHITKEQICRKCSFVDRAKKRSKSQDIYILEANEIHKNKYDYSLTIYINANTKITIICYEHGEFVQNPNEHLKGNGCPKCGIIKCHESQRLSQEDFIKRCKKIHGDNIDYSKVVYITNDSFIELYCTKHSMSFTIRASSHLYGEHSCRKCSCSRMSKVAREWLSMIQSSIPHIQTYDSNEGEYLIKSEDFYYFADGYDPLTKTIYEFHGSFWHGDPSIYQSEFVNSVIGKTMGELYKKTQEKKYRCIELGYKYVEIWESQWYRFKKCINIVQLRRKSAS
jgi:hypothetical protein